MGMVDQAGPKKYHGISAACNFIMICISILHMIYFDNLRKVQGPRFNAGRKGLGFPENHPENFGTVHLD